MKNNFKRIEKIIYDISPKKAEEELKKVGKSLRKDQFMELMIDIGIKYYTDDNNVAAKRIFKKILRLRPNKEDKAAIYLRLGFITIDEEKYLKGVVLFNKVLDLTKDNWFIAEAYSGLSSCYYSIPQREKSIYFAKKSLKYCDLRDKNQISYYYDNVERIIENYLLMGNFEKARRLIEKTLKEKRTPSKTISEIYADLGNYYFNSKEWGRAIENYQNSLRYFDSSHIPTKGRILMYLASCYDYARDYEKAKINYSYSLEFLENPSDINRVRDRLKEINSQQRKGDDSI